MNQELKHEIKILELAIGTYQSLIRTYTLNLEINPSLYYNKISTMNKRILDTEILIKILKKELILSKTKNSK